MAPRETKKNLRTTWVGFALLLASFATLSLYRHGAAWRFLYPASVFFAVVAAAAPFALLPVYRLWMKAAHLMVWINTRLLLGLVFFLVITPIGRLLRALGKDVLDERIDHSAASYWQPRTLRSGDDDYFRPY